MFLVAHDKKQLAYEYEESVIGDRIIPKHVTTEALESLGAILTKKIGLNCWTKIKK